MLQFGAEPGDLPGSDRVPSDPAQFQPPGRPEPLLGKREQDGGLAREQIVADRLTDESPQSADGIYFRCHDFVAEGSMVTEILLNAADFDAYLTVKAGGCPGGRVVAENDDFDDTLDSRIRRRLPPGPYAIVVSTVDGYATGDYLLTTSVGGIED